MKLTIYETILDPLLISNLPSTQACWLGYYFGSLYNDNSSADKGFLSNRKDNSFSLSFARGRFKVSSQDRKGNITYIDIYTKKIYSESPLSVAQNVSIIKNFDPSQACYIGILAGILATKNSTSTVTISKPKPALMVIK